MVQPLISSWTSEECPVSDRYDAWANLLNEAFGSWEVCKPATSDFSVSLHCYNDSILKLVDCTCDPCAGSRTQSKIAGTKAETVTIQKVLSGREYVEFDGEEMLLGEGDILIWDTTKPMQFRVQERLHKISVVLPLPRFQCWLPRSWSKVRHRIDGRSGSGLMLSNHIDSLAKSVFEGGCKDRYAVVDSTIGMLVNSLDLEDANSNRESLREIQLVGIKRFIISRIQDPGLCPVTVAKAANISLRYVHWLFEPTNETVTQYIIQQRLDFCARDLLNPHMNYRKLSDIAYSWGFKDVTHFSKRFKQRYDLTPRAFREDVSLP